MGLRREEKNHKTGYVCSTGTAFLFSLPAFLSSVSTSLLVIPLISCPVSYSFVFLLPPSPPPARHPSPEITRHNYSPFSLYVYDSPFYFLSVFHSHIYYLYSSLPPYYLLLSIYLPSFLSSFTPSFFALLLIHRHTDSTIPSYCQRLPHVDSEAENRTIKRIL